MPQTYIWKTQPIFISSTFTDMMAERDVLRDYVFPELEERLAERRVRLEPIDLRWGVETTDEKEREQKELTVLKVCLNEIDRCKPFFIGIIGDRYGWVPSEKRIKDAETEKGFQSGLKEKSVTVLEIEYGVLASKEQLQRSFFFFREPLPYDKLPPEKRADYSDAFNPSLNESFARRRLNDFKQLIIDKVGSNRVFNYKADWDGNRVTGLDEFKKQILEQLWKELDEETREFEETRAKTWEEEERKYLEDFIEERTITFSGREDVINELKDFALAETGFENAGLCLTGESGSGKSALFAKLYKELIMEDVLLLTHAAGISLRSSSLTNMLTIWIEELAEDLSLDIREELKGKNSFDDLSKMFAQLLSRIAVNKRIVILVDALNQFEQTPNARYVNWLPELLPENAKLIFTAVEGEETNNLSKRKGMKLKELKPMNLSDAEKIITIICSRYHKTLNPKAVKILLEKKREDGSFAYGNALWLTMAVDEFLLLDEDDFSRMKELKGNAEEKLEQLLLTTAMELPAGITEMYNYVFKRCERFGEEFSKTVLSYIGISRNGLRESDLEGLINNYTNVEWDVLNFAALRRYLRSHFVQRGELGLWDYRHLQARESLTKTILNVDEEVKHLHTNFAAELEKLEENDPQRLSEILWHLFKCDNKQRAAETYGTYWWDDYKTGEYSLTLKDILFENKKNIDWLCFLFEITNLNENERRALNNNLWFNLEDRTKNEIQLKLRLKLLISAYQSADNLKKINPDSAEYARDLSISYERIGDIYKALGDTKNALNSYESSHKIFLDLRKRNPDSAEYARDLSVSFNKVGDIYKALGDTKNALNSYESSHKIFLDLRKRNPDSAEYARDLSVSFNKVGDIYTALGDTKNALNSYESSLKIAEDLRKRNPDSAEYARDLSVSFNKVGDIYTALGDTKNALNSYESSHKIFLDLRKRNPDSAEYARDLSVSFNKVGDIYKALGDTKNALNSYESSHKIFLDLRKRNPDSAEYARDLSVSFNKVGDIYKALGDTKNALNSYESSHKIFLDLRKRNPDSAEYARDLSISYDRIGDIYTALGDTKNALNSYESSLKIREDLRKRNPDSAEYARDLSISYERIGDIYKALGDTKNALNSYESSLKIAEDLRKRNPDSAEYARDLSISYDRIGDIYKALGDTKNALNSYESSHKIFLDLRKRNPDSAEYARDLSISYDRIGDIYTALGDTKNALNSYESSLKIREDLRKRNPDSAEYARDLSISYDRIGDIYKALGDTKNALNSYESSHKIFLDLRKRNPDSAEYARDLSVSFNKVGDIYTALGDTKNALNSYESSLKIAEDLRKRNPDSAEYARDLSISYDRIGDIYKALGDTKNALNSYESSLKIAEDLRKRNPDSAEYARDLSISYDRIGDIYTALGDTKNALNSYESSLKIAEDLRKRNPDSAEYARDLSISYDRIGDIYTALGDTKNALNSYESSLKIREDLRKRNPDSAEYARDLWVSYWRMASINEQLGNRLAKSWWQKAYETLYVMKLKGLFISKEDEGYLKILEEKIK